MTVAPVSQTAQVQLLAVAKQVTEPKGVVLFRRGESAFGVFLVRSGKISLQLDDEEGKTLWKRIATRSSVIGLPATLAGGRYSLTAVTLQKSQLAFVDAKDLIDLIRRDPALGLELVRAVGGEMLQPRALLASTAASQAVRMQRVVGSRDTSVI